MVGKIALLKVAWKGYWSCQSDSKGDGAENGTSARSIDKRKATGKGTTKRLGER